MHGNSMTAATSSRAGARRSRRRTTRPRWYRVKVETDAGTYVGSLRIGLEGLRPLVEDARTYLALWNVMREGSPETEDFVALHKAAIRSVIVVGRERTTGHRQQEA